MLVGDDGRPQLIIEFAGRYSPEHVWSFHLDCEERGTAYELW